MQMLKVKFKIIYIPLFFIFLLGALAIGLADYISLGFSLEALKKADFWINIVCADIGIICMIISIILIKIDNFKDRDEIYLSYLNNILTFRRDKYIAPMFKKFCFEDNYKTKTLYYKYKIQKEFSKVKPTEQDIKIYYEGSEEEKLHNEYCQHVIYYDRLLDTDYINKMLPKLHIKYPAISDAVIFSGISIKDGQLVDYITKHKVLKIILDYLPRFLFSFGLIIILSTLQPGWKDINAAIVFKTVFKVFIILSQVYFAYSYANRYNRDVTLHDIAFRDSKLNEYKVWEDKQIKNLQHKEIKKEVEVDGNMDNKV